jgi:hypothetical protein
MIFFSEFGEDEWIAKNLPLPEKGFYVDVGANQPGAGSNTAFLRAKGWAGLAVDANPEFAKLWSGIPGTLFVAGIVSDEPIVGFDFKHIAGHSRVEKVNRLFATTTLDRLLQTVKPEVGRIDLLSLDVEGHEYNAFRSLNLFKWLPKIIISEYSTAGIGEDYRVEDLLKICEPAFELVHQTPANQIFFLREGEEARELFARRAHLRFSR